MKDHETTPSAFELRFSRLFGIGPALSFPCDAAGTVDLDSLGERARCKETAPGAQSHAREEPSIVAALCTCVLGEREGSEPAAWPPRSVVDLCGRSGGPVTGTAQDAGLLEDGLDALDELARRETGWRFARLDQRRQLRSLFQFEAGRGRLSRRHASAFMDAFLTLAAQAYLQDTPC